jgi:hypothetical protein
MAALAPPPQSQEITTVEVCTKPITLRSPILSLTIKEWQSQEEYIKEQISRNDPGINPVVGISCKKTVNYYSGATRISFDGSEFSRMQKTIFGLYDCDVFKKKQFEGIRERKSLLSVFQHTDTTHFFREYMVFDHIPTTSIFPNPDKLDVDRLYRGALDDDIRRYAAEIFPQPENPVTTLLTKYDSQMKDILRLCNSGKRVCILNFGTKIWGAYRSIAFHAVGCIFWKRKADKSYSCAVYDPYFTYHPSFDLAWSIKDHYVTMKLLSIRYGIKIKMINLGTFCAPKEKNGRIIPYCPQYVVDAQYCNMYVLYFMYCYGKNRSPIDFEGLAKVVQDTFIVTPTDLQRDNCAAINIFSLRMMSFILTACVCLGKNKPLLTAVRDTFRAVYKGGSGYSLLSPPFREQVLKDLEDLGGIGLTLNNARPNNFRVDPASNVMYVVAPSSKSATRRPRTTRAIVGLSKGNTQTRSKGSSKKLSSKEGSNGES